METIEVFKGGSLSKTCLLKEDGNMFVRKSVSLLNNREYGFQRWYSQLKKLQRFDVLFPGLFPKVLRFGKSDNVAYFDIAYYKDAINAQQYIDHCVETNQIELFYNSLLKAMGKLHKWNIKSSINAIDLYINEEIDQKIKDSRKSVEFSRFLEYEYIFFNGVKIKSFMHSIDTYKKLFRKCYDHPTETLTHGNITLENLLYIPEENRIIMIDPYEENIIDSVFAEYSQLLQSTNSKYETYNNTDAQVDSNRINVDLPSSFGIDYLNDKILTHIKKTYSFNDYIVIRLFEISQFIRMLPFKMEVDASKMFVFYGLASYLFEELLIEYRDQQRGIFND